MTGPSDAAIRDFWRWFRTNCETFGSRFENRAAILELDHQVCRLGSFAWELGPGSHEPKAFTISPGGDLAQLLNTKRVILQAPTCPGWEFHAAKPPKNWRRVFDLPIPGRVVTIDASNWRYVLRRFPDGSFDVRIADVSLGELSEDARQLAVEIVVDGEIGEERRLTLFDGIEAVTRFDDDELPLSHSIESFSQHLLQAIQDLS